MTVYVCSFVRDNGEGLIEQAVYTKSEAACEHLIGWLKNAARYINLGICDFEELEKQIRAETYYGEFDYGKKIVYGVDEFLIYIMKVEV